MLPSHQGTKESATSHYAGGVVFSLYIALAQWGLVISTAPRRDYDINNNESMCFSVAVRALTTFRASF